MATYDWRPFLEQYSRELIADRQIRAMLPQSVLEACWLGFDAASPRDVSELERRIGTELPESYRQFLLTTNGWRNSGGFIYDVFPCSKVEWFRTNNQEWIDAYVEPAQGGPSISIDDHCDYGPSQDASRFRVEYLQSTLLISDVGDSGVYLLNPEIRTEDGEWEAWFFANWHPGAARYPSFWDLMQGEFRSVVDLREQQEKRYFPEDGIETLPQKLPGLIAELADKARAQDSGASSTAARDAYWQGVVAALNAAEGSVKRLAAMSLAPDDLLNQLRRLDAEINHEWKANLPPDACDDGGRRGWAEGSRQAWGIIHWFLNQPEGATHA